MKPECKDMDSIELLKSILCASVVMANQYISWGRFTPGTMKSDHEGWPLSMVRLHGQTPWSDFFKETLDKAFGPLTRRKPNGTKRNDHTPKSECDDF